MIYAVFTRGHADDYSCMRHILRSEYSYLGMIGSRLKVAQTLMHMTKQTENAGSLARFLH